MKSTRHRGTILLVVSRVFKCSCSKKTWIGGSRSFSLLAGERLENFYVIALNAKCNVLGQRRISMGSLSEVSAYPRLVMETALNYNAHSILLCHNHPGGTCAPSPEDISSTLQLQRLLNGVGILVLDHIIVAGDKTYSTIPCSPFWMRCVRFDMSSIQTRSQRLRLLSETR